MVPKYAAPFLIGLEHKSRNLVGWKTVPQTLSLLVCDNAIFQTMCTCCLSSWEYGKSVETWNIISCSSWVVCTLSTPVIFPLTSRPPGEIYFRLQLSGQISPLNLVQSFSWILSPRSSRNSSNLLLPGNKYSEFWLKLASEKKMEMGKNPEKYPPDSFEKSSSSMICPAFARMTPILKFMEPSCFSNQRMSFWTFGFTISRGIFSILSM